MTLLHLVYASVHFVVLFVRHSAPFKITGISPQSNGVTVWTDTSGAEQNVRLNYTLTELFPTDLPPPSSIIDSLSDLRSSFVISGLKSDTWYGLHMASAYSWRGAQFTDPAHDVAFKTLSNSNGTTDNATTDSVSTPITIAARPVAGGFQLLVMNRLGDRMRSPMDAYVTSACAEGQNLGGRYRFTSDQPLRQTKDFLLNTSRLPETILHESSSQWAVDACHSVCWSLFVNAANVSYVLDTQCANLTEIFVNTGSDNALWDRADDSGSGGATGTSAGEHSKDDSEHGKSSSGHGDGGVAVAGVAGPNTHTKQDAASVQKRSSASTFESYLWSSIPMMLVQIAL